MDSSEYILKFSLQLALFSSHTETRILFSMFSFAYFIFEVLKCEAANFSTSPSACVIGRQINIYSVSLVLRDGQLASMHVPHDVHMTSLVFTACVTTHGMTWHDSHCT